MHLCPGREGQGQPLRVREFLPRSSHSGRPPVPPPPHQGGASPVWGREHRFRYRPAQACTACSHPVPVGSGLLGDTRSLRVSTQLGSPVYLPASSARCELVTRLCRSPPALTRSAELVRQEWGCGGVLAPAAERKRGSGGWGNSFQPPALGPAAGKGLCKQRVPSCTGWERGHPSVQRRRGRTRRGQHRCPGHLRLQPRER